MIFRFVCDYLLTIFWRFVWDSCHSCDPVFRWQEGHEEPWATFTAKMAVGMGQMETKVFPATFPEDFEVRNQQEGCEGWYGPHPELQASTEYHVPTTKVGSPMAGSRKAGTLHRLVGTTLEVSQAQDSSSRILNYRLTQSHKNSYSVRGVALQCKLRGVCKV